MSRPFLMRLAGLAVLAALLSACGSGPKTRPGRDGPEANPPSRLSEVPDAEPRIEPIRNGGPNKPYEVLGQNYTPMTQDRNFSERGLASWYGRKFHGRRTASGEVYDMYAMTAAHPTLPLPSYARIRNPANGREVIVRVNDRGPFHKGRIVDLSYTAALKLDLLRGVAPVELERITFAEIRSGAWRRDGAPTAVARAPAPEPVPAAPLDVAPPPVAPPESEGDGTPLRPLASAPRGFWIQLGAFRQRDGAESFQRRVADELDWLSPQLAVFVDTPLFRLQAGPYASREEARAGAERVREALQLVPVIVERK
ncbi:septal ring lytic transglycosylase RlpA family protein [Rhizobacter sp. AJA081-3]|uniref:septal ring lytic transglycosylase RlpA family protein n=1 Tax=Rhizobacter sp. AJA081-3 TaxID=2753607 RepID=UPI001ADF42B1|nr:septal ring lytic transglycosylase RlpA family protein [Rhizobacter sp. AJA081-3]QTN23293.1 septal ring lytic transglycosylase RlpA family protein [Rhizobacter sp. AJA081-3]